MSQLNTTPDGMQNTSQPAGSAFVLPDIPGLGGAIAGLVGAIRGAPGAPALGPAAQQAVGRLFAADYEASPESWTAAGVLDTAVHARNPLRAILLGGVPLGEPIVMWWNFVGRSHDEIVGFREAWQREVVEGADAAGRFGRVPDGEPPLKAPELPNVRLRPRE